MCSYMVQDARTTPPPPPKEEATDTFGVDPLEEMQGAIAHVAPLTLLQVRSVYEVLQETVWASVE